LNSKIESLKKAAAVKDEQLGTIINGSVKVRPELIAYLMERFAIKVPTVISTSTDIVCRESLTQMTMKGAPQISTSKL
jgi:hypothetical protein